MSRQANVKLRRLSANIQAERETSEGVEDIADIMNKIGDGVVRSWAEDNPDIMRRMGMELQEFDNERKLLVRIPLLPSELQKRVLGEVNTLYKAKLQELNSKGDNPFETRVIKEVLTKRSSEIYAVHNTPEPSILSSDKTELRKALWTLMADENFREKVGLVDPRIVDLVPGYKILFVPDNTNQRELLGNENFAIEYEVLKCLPSMAVSEQASLMENIKEVMRAEPVPDAPSPGM